MEAKIRMDRDRLKKISIAAVVLLLLGSAIVAFLLWPSKEAPRRYEPTVDLPFDYVILVDEPRDEYGMQFTAMLSSLAVTRTGKYNPMFILTSEGRLDDHQLHTINLLGLDQGSILLFTEDPENPPSVSEQVSVAGTYCMSPYSLSRFKGFDDMMSVSSFEEALWAAPIAKKLNLVMVKGEPTYEEQAQAWDEMRKQGIPFNYVMIVNPLDHNTTAMHSLQGYIEEDDAFHIEKLSAVAAEVAAYRDAYVLTEYTPSTEDIGVMDKELNQRAIGYYLALKEAVSEYGLPEYVTLVGSASAVPQFQLPDQTNADPNNVEGDLLVNSDVMYGFLGDDLYYMDSAVGRLVNLNVQAMSNQIVRTYLYDRFPPTITVDFSTGPRNVAWSKHGTSFSGYEITYKRGQVTPARFWCRDADDEGMTYDYFGPTGLGRDILIGDGIEPSIPADMNPALESSGYVAYRGHGSEYASLYNIPYVINRNENGVLRAEEVRDMFLPPQIGFFVACMNTKIHGAGWWKPAEPIDITRAFALNYLHGGAIVTGGATEVSFSNIGQDLTSGTEEWLPGVINPRWSDGNYEWDLNDAWFAFFWDGILNVEERYGSVGHALRWAENRYMNNPIHSKRVSPFIQDLDDPEWQGGLLGAHWKEVAMFNIYGDPAFTPSSTKPGANSYRPWVNGPNDTGEV